MRHKSRFLSLAQCLMALFVVAGTAQMASANSADCSAEIWFDIHTGTEVFMSSCSGTCASSTPPCHLVIQAVHNGPTMYWCKCGPGSAADDECELRWTGGTTPQSTVNAWCANIACEGTCPEGNSGSPNGDPEVGTRACPCQ